MASLAVLAFLLWGPSDAQTPNRDSDDNIAVREPARRPPPTNPPHQTIKLLIANPSFETDTIPAGRNWTAPNIDGWTVNFADSAGVQRPTTFPATPDGKQVAYINSTIGTGCISQKLSQTLTAGMRYQLTVAVGARPDMSFPGYIIQLLAGPTVLTEVKDSDAGASLPRLGQFVDVSTPAYTALPGDALLGQPLKIVLATRVARLNSQVNYDHVRLLAQPAVEVAASSPSIRDPQRAGERP